jgi:thiosulfate dehydrogenase [quinone] large subunit
LSTLGILDAGYLTIQHYTKDPFSCPIFGGCEQVTSSAYSQIFGVPIALLGALYYGAVLIVSLYIYFSNNKKALRFLSQATVLGFLFSIYLMYLQIYIIGAICFYCTMSALSSTLLFVTGATFLRKQKKYELKFIVNYITNFKIPELLLAVLRISLGFIFLWAFVVKVPVWLAGSSPAAGFLENGTSGIFSDFFVSLAYSPIVNFLYMFGLISVGTALILGIAKKLTTIGGVLMMLLIYMGNIPPKTNPIMDEHIIYIFLLLLLNATNAYSFFGIYKYWEKLTLVKKFNLLK